MMRMMTVSFLAFAFDVGSCGLDRLTRKGYLNLRPNMSVDVRLAVAPSTPTHRFCLGDWRCRFERGEVAAEDTEYVLRRCTSSEQKPGSI